MQQIRHRKANVDGFDVFYRWTKPANPPAHPLLRDLPISGHTFNSLAQEIGRFIRVIGRGCFATASRAITPSDFSTGNKAARRGFTPVQASVSERPTSQSAFGPEGPGLHNGLQECQSAILRLFGPTTIGTFTWDTDNRITGVNDAFLVISGHDRNSLVLNDMNWEELTPPEWRYADEASLMDLNHIGIALPYEKELLRKDGTRIPVLVTNAIVYRYPDQRLTFVVDLSDRKRAEQAARDSERRCNEAKTELARVNRIAITGQLSASIVHEVSQPIAGAVSNAQVALRRLSAEPLDLNEVRQALNRMVRDGNRAADVIHRIRALINKAAPRRENLEINQAIFEIVALMRGEVAKNGVSLQTQLAENLPAVRADRVQIQQVMLNLIVNAVEAMSTSGNEPRELRLGIGSVGSDALLITLQDSGPGVDHADLERVFETFYSTKPAGLGMGLSVCRAIVEGHGGKLWVSTAVPRGAVFQFTLPVCADGDCEPAHNAIKPRQDVELLVDCANPAFV